MFDPSLLDWKEDSVTFHYFSVTLDPDYPFVVTCTKFLLTVYRLISTEPTDCLVNRSSLNIANDVDSRFSFY